ncbi:orotate phosphoribosyltransferase [Corynebacterium atypicum]|uniref:orotate phosphoribosyltransferase n=1 Tax=Corynebacterium atypicum TaxID=191610 RepID=UPI000A05EE6E|nr:orotate phosphoribosyltransferase [Corynebacterium atypicum]
MSQSDAGTTNESGAVGSRSAGTGDRERLAELVRDLAVIRGRVTLSSGRQADYYVDLRRATLHHEAAPLIGKLIRELTADLDFDAVGGLTLGADPVAASVMHAPGRPIDAFVVRKEAKKHGMQRLIEGPDVAGRKVLVVEDTTTTGNSPLTAARALRAAGAEVVAVATVVDRETGAAEAIAAESLEYRHLLGLSDLGLD